MAYSKQLSPPLVPWRLRLGILLSLGLHALLLSIPIQGDVFGIAGLRLPWQERRLAASDLQVVLAPAPPPPAAVAAPIPVTVPVPVPVPAAPPAVAVAPPAAPRVRTLEAPPPAPKKEVREDDSVPPPPEPEPQVVDHSREVALIALAREQAERAETMRVQAERVAAERMEAERREQAQRDAARQEQEQEQEKEKERAAQREAAMQQEEARLEQARQAQREQLAREQAERERVAKEHAAKEHAAKEQAAKEQAAKEQAAKEQAAKEQAAKEQAARDQERASAVLAAQSASQPAPLAPREERLRAIAEQLAREAAQRQPAGAQPGAPLPTTSGLRRGWLFGRADPNQDLVQYAQAMSRKIEMNRTIDMVRDLVQQAHRQPVVTVAIRADGSVEKVTFETSSGVPAIDDGIRRIIASQAPFGPFPPALARQYDVVEIRRTWLFDVAVRLQ